MSQKVRQEIARDLHDGFAQDLTLVGYKIDGLIAASDDPAVRGELRQLRFQISSLLERTRRDLFALHRAPIRALSERISDYVSEIALTMTPLIQINESILSQDEQEELFFISRELLTNLKKHALSTYLKIELSGKANSWEFTFVANGSEKICQREGHFGLTSIQERCARIQADFQQEVRGQLLYSIVKKNSQ